MPLDARDRQLLFELDKNCRQPLTALARKLRVSPQVVEYRIKRLQREEIVGNFLVIADYRRLGLSNPMVYLKLQNIGKKKEDELVEWLKDQPATSIVLRLDGRWDLSVGFFVHDFFELNDKLEELNSRYGEFIREDSKSMHIGSYQFYRGYLNKAEVSPLAISGGPVETLELDKEDLLILQKINETPRANVVELAEKTSLSTDVVRYRLKKLMQNRAILRFSWLAGRKFPMLYYRLLLNLKNVNKQRETELLSYANNHPNIFRAIKFFGDWNFLLDIEVASPEAFREFLSKFREDFDDMIRSYEPLRVYNIEKFTYLPLTENLKVN